MTAKDSGGPRRLLLEENLTLVWGENVDDSGDDLVRILTKLTSDVERFDSMVVYQRKMLEQRAIHAAAVDDDQIAHRSEKLSLEAAERLGLEAAEMAACAREALARLRGVSETRESRASA